MSAVAAKLAQARELVEAGWCQGFSCMDADGKICGFRDAVKFCAFGAICYKSYGSVGERALHMLEGVVGENPIRWNDHPSRTKSEVIEAFREAEQRALETAA